MKLGLIADTRHYLDSEGRPCALTPVVRQLDLWADWFPEMVACVPLLPGPPPPTHTPYQRLRVSLRPLHVGGGNSLRAKIGLGRRIVEWWPRIQAVIREVDAVHLRCPCNVALLGILAVQRSDRRRYAMYGGQWQDYPGQPRFSRLQRRLLAHPGFGGPVAIYGSWPGQARHLVSSFSPNFTLAEWEAEHLFIEERLDDLLPRAAAPVRLVTVGYLDANKSQGTILSAVAILRAQGLDIRLDCVGDGPLRSALLTQRARLGLEEAVRFHGARPYAEVCEFYRCAHINILASRTEGYPKVLTEGMLHGAVPVAADIGINRQILGNGQRGLAFTFGEATELADRVHSLAKQPEQLGKMIHQGRLYTQSVTLEAFQALHHRMLAEQWNLALPAPEGPCSRPAGVELSVG